jgi:hypothetical protein
LYSPTVALYSAAAVAAIYANIRIDSAGTESTHNLAAARHARRHPRLEPIHAAPHPERQHVVDIHAVAVQVEFEKGQL